jgi:hypothetical protein
MQPPRGDANDPAAAAQLEEISEAVEAGRLVELLTSKGLTRSTVDELLRPESAVRLRTILAGHLHRPGGRGRPEAGTSTPKRACEGGKVLVFRPKEAIRR